MFDTHCHLNFKAFKNNIDEVIENARKTGVTRFLIPGTDVESSIKAVEIAEKYDGVYAAVGIHPHHVFQTQSLKLKTQNHNSKLKTENPLKDLEKLLVRPKVVAVGEAGIDKHQYIKTKYPTYEVGKELVKLQKELLRLQINLAIKYKKALIIHNREATEEVLEILTANRSLLATNKIVFHCCEPSQKLLDFAKKNHIYIGVDGDVTYNKNKMEFVKKIPVDLLVLETDSPYLLPEPLKSKKTYPNKPENIPFIAEFIAKLRGIEVDIVKKTTVENAITLFGIHQKINERIIAPAKPNSREFI